MLADIVGLKIRNNIGPGNYIADGWSCAGVHYWAMLHRWPALVKSHGASKIEIKTALISCSPFVNEKSEDSKSQMESIEAAYGPYRPKGEIDDGRCANRLIVCFTMDNASINPCVARSMGKPMVGAYCHRLNLAAKHFLQDAFGGNLDKDLDSIKAVMLRASSSKARGALKEFTPLLPEKNNKARWTGFQDMGIKYTKIHSALARNNVFKDLHNEKDSVIIENAEKTKPEKKVFPELLSAARLRRFQLDFLPALKNLRGWFTVIQ
jgi:hypothetical protein